ncbi:hypothetical protein H072_9586 [Dactylellina haptotyla CBS 200.50]|uniref:SMP-LTD domain-containing protein n=1 Tax=Dactylellina haptotyla (strain CBS 200.50) TaxID=1284197 RepID=S8BNW5_DACHA|nr:hypothetical protein H072_9586 [Dactylellina haptotyla CBS 200.50]
MGFWFAYFLGAFTFVPFVCSLIFALAYYTFPTVFQDQSPKGPLRLPTDDDKVFASTDDVSRLKRNNSQDGDGTSTPQPESKDVAAGYFAVTREYVPGGVNGKPPERPTPNGNLPTESPSVYQTMYRSLFERKPAATASVSTNTKGKNVFFVVLRHGHLMLYDDSEQVEVRHVISLTHHTASIYGGEGEIIPEGELYIKRNAIRLSRRETFGPSAITNATSMTKPFFLFSENCSDKEDFYFALVKNQEREDSKDGQVPPSRPLGFETKHIISLVQRLHSSEEDLQTRWLNGLVGRLFLALYRTNEVEEHIRSKITKKIARVKRPAFLSNIIVQKIDCGEGAPFITNPKMRELTADGEFSIEGDVKYAGNFRIEISTVATLSLGNRFKPRQVPLVLAVVFKKLEGHAIVRLKPPPSNRFWFTFSEMPKMDVAVEPIVSSRQITWSLVLRPIENRIKEVIAETVVSPNWDDIPFVPTLDEPLRGGLWESMRAGSWKNADLPAKGSVEDAEKNDKAHEENDGVDTPPSLNTLLEQEKSMSMPVLIGIEPEPKATNKPRRSASSASTPPAVDEDKAVSSGLDSPSRTPTQRHKSRRSASIGTPISMPASAVVGTTTVTANAERQEPKYDDDKSDAVSSVLSITKSRSSSVSGPAGDQTPYGSPTLNDSATGLSPSSASVTTIETGSMTPATTATGDSKSVKSWKSMASTDTNKTTNTAAENLKTRLGTFKSNFSNISFPKAFNNNSNGNGNTSNNPKGSTSPGESAATGSPQPSLNPEKNAFATFASTTVALKKWYINTRNKNEAGSATSGGNGNGNPAAGSTIVESGFHPVSEMENAAQAIGIAVPDDDVKPEPVEAPPTAILSNKAWQFGNADVPAEIVPSNNSTASLPANLGSPPPPAVTADSTDRKNSDSGSESSGKSNPGSVRYKYPVPPWEIPQAPAKRTAPIEVPKRKALPPPLLPPRQPGGISGRAISSSSSSKPMSMAGEQQEMMVIAAPVGDPTSNPATPGEPEIPLQGVYLGSESPEERRMGSGRGAALRAEWERKNSADEKGKARDSRLELPDYDGEGVARRLSSSGASVRSNGSRGSRGSTESSRWEMKDRPYGRRTTSYEEDQAPTSRSWKSEEEDWRLRNRLVSEITGEEG